MKAKDNFEGLDPVPDYLHLAFRPGLIAALLMGFYELAIHLAHSDTLEGWRFMKYLILFATIGMAMSNARSWIRNDRSSQDSMIFGLAVAIVTAFGVILFNGLISIINYRMEISDTIAPVDGGLDFAVNSIGTLFGCLGYGFMSSFIFSYFYKLS
ncbi:MAG: hypothetical protein H6562_05255 [Lewinellaceae bacterium]|nr:hypothetical protein [Lewinella sp.]MCB9278299.1 hypothetical protein [Lewinellaceae bacterium]